MVASSHSFHGLRRDHKPEHDNRKQFGPSRQIAKYARNAVAGCYVLSDGRELVRKIIIFGNSGSGKSTLAAKLGDQGLVGHAVS